MDTSAPSPRRPTLVVPLFEQALLTVFSALLVDGGRVATAGHCVSVAFWAGALTICARRKRDTLAHSDRLCLSFGLPLAWGVGVPLFHWIWFMKGAI